MNSNPIKMTNKVPFMYYPAGSGYSTTHEPGTEYEIVGCDGTKLHIQRTGFSSNEPICVSIEILKMCFLNVEEEDEKGEQLS